MDYIPWWPHPDAFWPAGIPYEATIDAFVAAFATVGYVVCANGVLETDFEKIALSDFAREPKHAARQLPDGRWTSKLGQHVDIVHADPRDLNGPECGTVVRYIRRRRVRVSNIAR